MKKNYVGKMVNLGVTNMVGIGMLGATSGMTNALPSGTAKSIVGVVPGLQATSLVAHNASFLKSKSSKKKLW